MIVTVPEKPVAGEEVVVYFNRNASEILKGRPSINLTYGFNKWDGWFKNNPEVSP